MSRPPVLYAHVTEKQWLSDVIDIATLFGWSHYHTRDSRGSVVGFPDLVLLRGKRLIFAELKTTTGRMTPAQDDWIDALRKTSAEVYVWRPQDVIEVTDILRTEG